MAFGAVFTGNSDSAITQGALGRLLAMSLAAFSEHSIAAVAFSKLESGNLHPFCIPGRYRYDSRHVGSARRNGSSSQLFVTSEVG